MSLSRRSVLSGSAALLAMGGLSRALAQPGGDVQEPLPTPSQVRSDVYASDLVGYGPLREDPAGLFDLPDGFSYTVVSRAGEPMDDGLLVPYSFDGMGCFSLGGDRVALVRNHELKPSNPTWSAFGPNYERPAPATDRAYDRFLDGRILPGGTTTVVYDLRRRRVERQHLSLAGTIYNCAGGVTPRNTWLTCEETVIRAGDRVGQDHGWVFEVAADTPGMSEAVPIRGLGRFRHEAAATDPRTGIVYLTEDEADDATDDLGLFYRFLPSDPNRLLAGGRLQALGIRGEAEADPRNRNSAYWAQGDWRQVTWIDLDGTDNPDGALRLRGRAAGAAPFARGEGIAMGRGELFFACTAGGPRKRGQIFRYAPSPVEGQPGERDQPGRLQLFAEPTEGARLDMPDNLAVTPWGHLLVCEDKAAARGVNYLRGVTPEGWTYTLGRNLQPMVSNVGANSELAGVCMSPDGTTLFVNVYAPGLTVAITGPWARFRNERTA